SLRQDKADIGGEQVVSKYQYTFHMKSMDPTKSNKGAKYGSLIPATSRHLSTLLLLWSPSNRVPTSTWRRSPESTAFALYNVPTPRHQTPSQFSLRIPGSIPIGSEHRI